jgi:hypothetical protein
MAATAAQTMWPMLPREKSNFKPIKEFSHIAAQKKMDGILCTAWDDTSPHMETFWRGFHHFAFFSWNHEDINAETASAMFRHRFYAPALSEETAEFQDLLEQALVFWEKALIDKGHRNNYPESMDLIRLPDPKKSGAWSKQYHDKLIRAKEEVSRYETIKQRISATQQLARRNQYSLELINQMNELQIYPAHLLLLLAAYDKETSPGGKKAALRKLQDNVNNFRQIRKNYEDVFSRTRILVNPEDYVLDANGHHHLANGTVNNDWMFVYELAMNDKINRWIPGK